MKIKVIWFNPSHDKPDVFEVDNLSKEMFAKLEEQYKDKIITFTLI